jgi:hypothetical protein
VTIVCFKWKPHQAARTRYDAETVLVMRAMVQRWYPQTHRFVCVTDDPQGLGDVEVLPLWSDFADVPSPHGGKNPSCYRRLKLFDPAIASLLGERFLAIDLDCIITGDLTPIVDRADDFVMYGDTNPKTHYNGSLILMTAGARAKVWETFDPKASPRKAYQSGCFGSDQGWISYCLGGGEHKFTKAEGVYSYRNDIKQMDRLPADARIVVFHGDQKPWTPQVQSQHAWVRTHYMRQGVAA